ncbi:MAG: M56 family metallopeptidase, partial [Oscillospiraceae bacterium]|nr:M56 family metallopeptidase [Oscillospiraceae bacterium]
VYAKQPNVDTGIEAVNQIVNPVLEYSFTPAELSSVNPIQIALELGGWIWLLGMAAMLVYAMISYIRLRRLTAPSIRLQDNVYICDGVDSPFVLGIIKPKIILSSSLDDLQIASVIAHEKAHLKRFDHCWKLLGFLALAVHWFNPLVWLAYALFCRDIELACDESVISKMDSEGKKAYSNALLCCSMKPGKMLVCPLAFGEVSVKQRIKAVLSYKKAPVFLTALAVIICLVAAACFLTNPKEPKAFKPEDIHDLKLAELYSQYGDPVLDDTKKLRTLEEKLSNAKAMEAVPACPFDMRMEIKRADGTEGIVQLASDGCEIYYSDGVYYDYGINKTGSVLSEFGFKPFHADRETDKQGNIVKEVQYDWFTPIGIKEYSYEGGMRASTTHRNGKGELLGMQEHEYDEQGRMVKEYSYVPDEQGQLQLDLIIEIDYDEQGNVGRPVYYNPDGSPWQTVQNNTAEPGIKSIYRHD